MLSGILKFGLCITGAGAGVLGLVMTRNSYRECYVLDRLVIGAWFGRVGLAVAIYLFAPDIVQFSDAKAFYLPETLDLVTKGLLPYNGFSTSYGPLFHLILAPGVALWPSAGAITLTMLLAEGILLKVYLQLGDYLDRSLLFRRVAWVSVTSPLFIYWNGIGGYNSVLIAMFAMLGLSAAARGRPVLAGLAGTMAFLGSKALGALAWPTIVLFGREGYLRRALPIFAMFILLGIGAACGWDVMMPIHREHGSWSAGNLWFLAAVAFPPLFGTIWVSVLSGMGVIVGITAGTWRYWKCQRKSSAHGFDLAVAHFVWVLVVFLLLSKKSMPMYPPMLLPFAAHLIMVKSRSIRALIPLLVLGSLTTIQVKIVWLEDMIVSRHFLTTIAGGGVLAVDVVRILALAMIGSMAWRMMSTSRSDQDQDGISARGLDSSICR